MQAIACLNDKLQNSLSLYPGWGMQIKLHHNALSSLFKVLSEVRTRKFCLVLKTGFLYKCSSWESRKGIEFHFLRHFVPR